ncbi:MAG: hypothetical protein ACI9HK_003814, partial [Pirellulaceae bacterium]
MRSNYAGQITLATVVLSAPSQNASDVGGNVAVILSGRSRCGFWFDCCGFWFDCCGFWFDCYGFCPRLFSTGGCEHFFDRHTF